jgi:hypothetical protein
MNDVFAESTVEDAALEIFPGLGHKVLYGPTIAPGEIFAERASCAEVVLVERLRQTLTRINSEIPRWRCLSTHCYPMRRRAFRFLLHHNVDKTRALILTVAVFEVPA